MKLSSWKGRVILNLLLLVAVLAAPSLSQQSSKKTNDVDPLESIYEVSFKIYKKAIELAHQANLTADQKEDLENIFAEQPSLVHDTLAQVSGSAQIQQNFNGNIGFVFIKGPLNQSQSDILEKALIQHHLHFARQIIHLVGIVTFRVPLHSGLFCLFIR